LVRGVTNRGRLWRIVIARLRKKGFSFVIEPFASYVINIKNLDPGECLEGSPCAFYKIAMEYFGSDREAVRFFLDYILSTVAPDKFSLRMEIVQSMEECDDEKAKDLIRRLLESIIT